MNKRIFTLTVTVVLTAVAVVHSHYMSRLLFTELQMVNQERDALNIEWGQLLLEEGAWSQQLRVEATAQKKLAMAMPDQDQIVIVDIVKKNE